MSQTLYEQIISACTSQLIIKDFTKILTLATIIKCLNLLIYKLLQHYKLTETAASSKKCSVYIVSTILGWVCTVTSSIVGFTAYYIYDIFNKIVEQDYVLLTHHVFTIFMIGLSPDHLDHSRVIRALLLLKIGDLFIYTKKILKELNIYKTHKILSNILIWYSSLYTIIAWTITRCWLPFYLYPFSNELISTISIGFHIMNFLYLGVIIKSFILLH
jgi:hypothetical protein